MQVRYELRNADDGTTIDAGRSERFVIGENQDFLHLDAVVQGMSVGETKETLLGDSVFGERNEDWVVKYGRDDFPSELEVGLLLTIQDTSAQVVAFDESSVTLDFNNPLAGLNVTVVATLESCEAPIDRPPVVVEAISAGDGTSFPRLGDKVSVHCVASYVDGGEVFYSSREQGAPYDFQLGAGQVIEGLELGIQNVSIGGKAKITIPAQLAYGRQNANVVLPVDKDVIFEVELLSID